MGHSNQTTNLHLPQFIGSDKPTWLSDINGAFAAIDSAYGTIETDSAAAVTAAGNAVTTANAANTTAGNASTAAASASTQAGQALTAANNAAYTANQADAKASAAKTLAEGELIASVTADGVKTYKALLNELYAAIPGGAAITAKSYMTEVTGGTKVVYQMSADRQYTRITMEGATSAIVKSMAIDSADSFCSYCRFTSGGNSFTDQTETAAPSGRVYNLYA